MKIPGINKENKLDYVELNMSKMYSGLSKEELFNHFKSTSDNIKSCLGHNPDYGKLGNFLLGLSLIEVQLEVVRLWRCNDYYEKLGIKFK